MKDSVIKISLLALFLIVTVSCGAGPALRGEAESDVTTNIEDGEVDVDVNSAVSMTFTAPVSVAGVNANSFFIVQSSASSSVSSNSINVKSALDPAVCNPANAVAGTIAQTGTGACDTVFELTPDSALEFNTDYVVCATNGIGFCDPNRYGVFVGFQKSFTTVEDSGTTYSIGGTVSGLTGTVVLQNNAADDLTITEDGSFIFATEIESGAVYEVSVKTQPSGQTCSVTSGTGNAAADVTNVAVTCTTTGTTYSIGGTVSGLTGTVVLQNNAADDLTITENGSFTFATELDDGATYEVSVLTQPAAQICTITNGSGTATGNTTNVDISCVDAYKIIYVAYRSISSGGNLGGISGADTICNNDADKPDESTYKALLVDGTDRVACTTANCSGGTSEHTDWVLSPSTEYRRTDGTTTIGITNSAGIFVFPLDNSVRADYISSFTGLGTDWTTIGSGNCSNWTTSVGLVLWGIGGSDRVDSGMINLGGSNCSSNRGLQCVEQ